MKTKSSCEKGRDLDPNRVEAPIDDGLMTCRYLMELRKRALIRPIPAVDSWLVRWPQFQAIGLIGRHPLANECDYEVRMLAPSSGMSEDPITGSLNAALAHWLVQLGRLDTDLLIAQGTCINRVGRVAIRPDSAQPGRVFIGGESHVLVDGTLIL